MTNLTKHFTLESMVRSQTAARRRIDNEPSKRSIANMRRLCETVLEPLRIGIGKPIYVTSGYRSRKLNIAIGGSTKSKHMAGLAADIVTSDIEPIDLARRMVAMELPFDKLIVEFDRWVHVSVGKKGEVGRETMQAKHSGMGVVYSYIDLEKEVV